MANRNPLVSISGVLQELPLNDELSILTSSEGLGGQSGFSADTFLAGSFMIPGRAPVVGTAYELVFDVTKTAAGIATPIIKVRFGTAGSTADTARLTFTFGAGTAAVDAGIFTIRTFFSAVGATGVLKGFASLTSNLTTTGLSASVKARVATSASFDTTVANSGLGVSYNGGTSAAHTVTLVSAKIII